MAGVRDGWRYGIPIAQPILTINERRLKMKKLLSLLENEKT
jgi:hypothetical protein